ncbi:MAG: hypothetical protein EPO19_09970 [Betaproteobacteria bacterium]|nr:MAG: hypothetical protein EPO19_09970 [Betaproteobacteria bacterium]
MLTAVDFDPAGNDSSVLDELREQLGVMTNDDAIRGAVNRLEEHFKSRGSRLPFSYDADSSRFRAIDKEYLELITQMREIRGKGKGAKTFELCVMRRVKLRVTGALHRVGHPRDVEKKKKQFNAYLTQIGFNGNVLTGSEKDGGFDILWELPIGAEPHRPLVSLQCKNSVYRLNDGDASCGPAKRSLNEHRGLMAEVHVLCVFFNDYITSDLLPKKKAMQWVPLGLSDLGTPRSITASANPI